MPPVDRLDPEFAVRDPVPLNADCRRSGKDKSAVFVGPQEHLGLVDQDELCFPGGIRVLFGQRSETLDILQPFGNLDGFSTYKVASVHAVEAQHVLPVGTEEFDGGVVLLQLQAVPFDAVVAGVVDRTERAGEIRGGDAYRDMQQEGEQGIKAGEEGWFHVVPWSWMIASHGNSRFTRWTTLQRLEIFRGTLPTVQEARS